MEGYKYFSRNLLVHFKYSYQLTPVHSSLFLQIKSLTQVWIIIRIPKGIWEVSFEEMFQLYKLNVFRYL